MKTKLSHGTLYPVLKADDNGFVECPFCKKKHKHGKGNGHRIPHCKKGIDMIYDTILHYPQSLHHVNGYFIEY